MDAVRWAPRTPERRAAEVRAATEEVRSSAGEERKAAPEARVARRRPMLMASLLVERA